MGMKQAMAALVGQSRPQPTFCALRALFIQSFRNNDFLHSIGTEEGESQETHG